MSAGASTYDHNPSWWSDHEMSAWERVKGALTRDWDQTRSDVGMTSGQDLEQSASDTVRQAVGAEAMPARHVANASRDISREEYALRFGYSAGVSPLYQIHNVWNPNLEALLHAEWDSLHGDGWERARSTVGYAFAQSRAAL